MWVSFLLFVSNLTPLLIQETYAMCLLYMCQMHPRHTYELGIWARVPGGS